MQNDKIIVQDERGDCLAIPLDKLIAQIARAMMIMGCSETVATIDLLHHASLTVHWSGKDPKDHRGDDDCG